MKRFFRFFLKEIFKRNFLKKHIFDLLKKGYDEVKRKEKIEADTKNKAEEEAKKERMQSLKHLNQAAKIVSFKKITFLRKINNFINLLQN